MHVLLVKNDTPKGLQYQISLYRHSFFIIIYMAKMHVIDVISTLQIKDAVFDRFRYPTQTPATLLYSMLLVCVQAFNMIYKFLF